MLSPRLARSPLSIADPDRTSVLLHHRGSIAVHRTLLSRCQQTRCTDRSGDNPRLSSACPAPFFPSLRFSTSHSLLGSQEPALLCNHVVLAEFSLAR